MTHNSHNIMDKSKWKNNPIPQFEKIDVVQMLIGEQNDMLFGIKMFNKEGDIIFNTGYSF